MSIERLDSDFVTGFYDERTKLLMVQYHKRLSSEITGTVYAWLAKVIANHTDKMVESRGSVYDFSEVKKFDLDNLVTANQNSVSLNTKFDIRNHPVALIAKTRPQHEYLGLTVKITPDEERKKVVATLEEALAFIDEFHVKRAAEALLPPKIEPAVEPEPDSTPELPKSSQSFNITEMPEKYEV